MATQKAGRKILVHTCCAPCLIHPLALLQERGYEVVPFFFNPNIHPFREYRERYLAVVDFCESRTLVLRTGPYEMEQYFAAIADPEAERAGRPPVSDRCARCFAMRLSRAASEARRLGIPEFTTTLLVSPYQDQELIREAGESAAIEFGVHFVFEDMTGGYQESVTISREAGMYRQSYCGCVYSEKERYQKSDPPRR
ncbi:MAG: epoxyqueuosine reductase QueH [Candidatus Geothermincolia bacterium]